MNRKVILIFGNGGLAFDQKGVATFIEKLTQLDNIDLEVVGNGEQNLTMNEISQSLDTAYNLLKFYLVNFLKNKKEIDNRC